MTLNGIEYASEIALYDCLFASAGMNVHTLVVEDDSPNGPIVYVDNVGPILLNPNSLFEAALSMGLTEFTRFFQGGPDEEDTNC